MKKTIIVPIICLLMAGCSVQRHSVLGTYVEAEHVIGFVFFKRLTLNEDSTYTFNVHKHLQTEGHRGTWRRLSDREIELKSRVDIPRPSVVLLPAPDEGMNDSICFILKNPNAYVTYRILGYPDSYVHEFRMGEPLCLPWNPLLQKLYLSLYMEAYMDYRTVCSDQFILSASRGGSYVLEIKDENLLYAGPSTSNDPEIRSFYNFQDTVRFSGKKLVFTSKDWVLKRVQ